MFTQCPECKTIFGFSEEHTQVANGQVRCSQCSHVFVAMEHAMEELPTTNNTQTTTETAPVPAPESNEIATENIVDEPTAEETSTDSDNDDSFSLFDDANDFMAAISDDFVRPEPSIEENIVFNELGNDSSTAGTHTEPAPASVTVTPEPDKSTIESAMAEEKITQPVSAATAEEDEADNLADEWASMLEEEETPEAESEDEALSAATAEAEPVTTPTPEEGEADNLADEWASMLEEEETPEAESEDEALSAATAEAEPVTTPTPEESSAAAETGSESHEETPEPAEQETEDLASEWASMLDDEEDTELTTDIEKIGVPDEATSMESADTTETSDSVTSDESANEEKTDELSKNSS
ncbi:MAG: zinc-ribbon domain-containing protein, partial [Gammaproteobacteria bacterium]|nr:zinc-ribbon domain-containing protein [Gammaproteobacteria bacterium]